MRIAVLAAAALGLVVGLTGSFEPVTSEDGRLESMRLEISKAHAQPPPGAGRRTVRRTARRVARRNSIAGCTPYNAYYNCGGVYYRPVVENGVTVYIIVNP